MRVLVVDDYPGAAQASCLLLYSMGHEAKLALDGSTAIEVATSFTPDIVILDIALPDRSGYDVARELCSLPSRPFIVALTGWTTAPARVKTLAAGIDLHVDKPASMDKLRAIIEAARQRLDASA